MPFKGELDRRAFLKTAGASPLLQAAGTAATADADETRFTPLDLAPHFSASATDFGARPQIRFRVPDGLIRTPAGRQLFRGIPFLLGSGDVRQKSWIALSTKASPWTRSHVEIPLGAQAKFICLAQFCDWDESELRPSGLDDIEKVGQLLAEAVLVYDGGEKALPIRRRFEVGSPSMPTGHRTFTAFPSAQLVPTKFSEGTGTQWGGNQTGVRDPNGPPLVWICALENPEPERTVKAIRLRAAAADPLMVCALTVFNGPENPLRYGTLNVYRITLPEGAAADPAAWKVTVDLGVVARTYVLGPFEPESWLSAPDTGPGERGAAGASPSLYAEVAANPSATLWLEDLTNRRRYAFDLGKAARRQQLEARTGGARVELLEDRRTWLHGRVLDGATGRPTPVRLSFRSPEGRYIPPHGHRRDINSGWFQDYGADLKLRDSSFAYIDGTFQIELPVGEVFVEMTKGFEYQPVRQRLTIKPGQRDLELKIPRFVNLRENGWVTADTHVHFLSPSTAILEGQAEGLNLINLLAAQWGDLYTNVGDLPHGPLSSRDGETVVWPGTENRSNVMGHVGLLGGHGEPVFPLSGSAPFGPDDAYFGEPLRTTMADWTDACRARDGLAVAVHFPYPPGELAADVVLGKIDAVEVVIRGQQFNSLRVLDWYRYLNCGYRLPVVGGTDKMSADVAVGAIRTYAYLGQEEFGFPSWARAVRAGNTFTTTGPLLFFQADGRTPGSDITMRSGGGSVEVRAEARSAVPLHRVEIVLNGRVVATREDAGGARELTLRENVRVPGPGWLAARCASRYGTAAHTSPVYIRVPGEEAFSMRAAAYMLTLIEGTQGWVENLVTRPDAATLEHIRAVLRDAHARLHSRMQKHSHRHG
jgi:hypothetical protein